MEIRALDEAALADDAVMRDVYELNRRAQLHGRPDAPYWTFAEFLGAHRAPDTAQRQELFAAYDGDRMVGTAGLWSSLLDNTDKCFLLVRVDLAERRRGIGRALIHRLEQVARDDHRALIITSTVMPFEDRETHAHRRFAEACGYELSDFEVVRHLALPVPGEQVQAWIDEAAPHHPGYRLETFVGSVPDDLVESLCVLLGQLALDAPSGSVDYEEQQFSPQRYAEMLALAEAMGRVSYETVALTPDRRVVAQSTLALSVGESTEVFQWGTFVHREHRGHRLGLATKAANLRAVQAARGDLTRVITENSETNGHMVSINERMGFRAIEISAEFTKRL